MVNLLLLCYVMMMTVFFRDDDDDDGFVIQFFSIFLCYLVLFVTGFVRFFKRKVFFE